MWDADKENTQACKKLCGEHTSALGRGGGVHSFTVRRAQAHPNNFV